ncbi:methyl-accepting chemotaxis protein [Salicola sp. Rm-C-2C1-2]|uniref:methyl-accepting chemotaxis protein n=1 Tax=Salicola sp. Rm-C-2C1-2 TaxID=3141321 RepID=UPI0032E3F957
MKVALSRSILFRFVLINALVLFVLMVAFGWFNYSQDQQSLERQLEREVGAAMERLTLSVPGMLWNYEFDKLKTLVESEMGGVSIGGIYIHDNKGELVAGRRIDDSNTVIESDTVPSAAEHLRQKDLSHDGKKVGQLTIVADPSTVNAMQHASLIRTLVQTLVMIVIMVAVLALLTQQLVNRPIRNVQQALQDIARGEGDLTQRLDVSRQDEVGAVAEAFNGFVGKIQELIGQVVGNADRINESTESLQQLSARTASGVNNQRAETDQVAAAMNEMGSTAHGVAESANNAANATQKADDEGVHARDVVQEATVAIRTLAEEIESGAAVINDLDQAVNDITSMVEDISGIAEQTNLLALNAAIEAARAGEQGRGFAVVADEVRNLASRTQASTGEINQKIQKLQEGAQRAVSVMQQSKERGETTVEKASEAETSLGQVREAVSTINDMNVQIASAAEEQTTTVEEINQSLQRIVDVAEAAAKDTQSTEAASEEVSQLVGELRQLVGTFRV